MKILIVSDSHGKNFYLDKAISKVGPIDMLIHCGDAEGSEDYLGAILDCPVEIVGGNNDFFSDLPWEKDLKIGKYKVFLTHGHKFRVTQGVDTLKRYGIENNYDIIIFGHTHRPLIEYDNRITMINPGSITRPRQDGKKPSFILMELDRKGEVHFSLNLL